jgi:hypothetical protein
MNRNIFNRRMFAQGDEVTSPLLNEEIMLELEEIGIDPTNKSYEEINDEIDAFISKEKNRIIFDPTDPVDYLSAGLTLTGIGAGLGGGIKAARAGVKGKQAYEKISRLQQIKNILNPIQKTPGKVQMSKTGEAIVGAPSVGLKLPQSSLYAGQGVSMLSGNPLEMNDMLTEAFDIKSELNNLEQSEVKKEEEFKVEKSKNNTKTKSSEKEMEEAYKNLMSVYGTAKENASKDYEKRKNTFDRTNLFLEEISTALAESGGDIGYGLSTGAAKAAKRISEEEMLEKEKFSSFLKDQQEANKLSPSERTKIAESYSESITHLDNMGFILGQVEDLENMVDTGKVTGFSGLTGRVLGKIKGFTGFRDDIIEDETKSLQILEFIRSQLIRELLNESGRTISNLDRQLIDQITGDIADIGSGKGAIKESISRVKDRIRTAINKSRNNVAFIDNEFGAQMPNLQIYREGFGQRSEKPSYEKDDVVVTEEDVINPGRSRNK